MPGGLLNLVAYGNQNVILNGNPSKTFFKTTYAKYTNFGLQKFRIDFSGQRTLRMTESSVFDFTVPRYGDLLMDTYLVVNLPHIWSPVINPSKALAKDSAGQFMPPTSYDEIWQPYNFEWIDNLGTQMIERVRFTVGGQTIQEFSGQYLLALAQRDFSAEKKALYDKMTGNTRELTNPSSIGFEAEDAYSYLTGGGVRVAPNGKNITIGYPSAMYGANKDYETTGSEPSIRGRQVYIPINIWFTLAAKMALPLVSLQYAELKIEITIRPVQDLFTVKQVYGKGVSFSEGIRDWIQNATNPPAAELVASYVNALTPRVRPNFNDSNYGMYRFLQSPPAADISDDSAWIDRQTNWNADVHLVSTYAFLTDDEVRLFAAKPQRYLVRQSYTTTHHNVVGTKKIDVKSLGMVANYMWFFQRSDISDRNQWSNYTNWPTVNKPYETRSNVFCENDTDQTKVPFPELISTKGFSTALENSASELLQFQYISTSGNYQPANQRLIMSNWALLLDGKYRENQMPSGVYDYVEKYVRTSGNAPDGLYCYNLGLHSNPFDFQPSGAINMSKFTDVQFELTTITPSLDKNAQFNTICGANGEVVGVSKPAYGIYDYTYDLTVMEERWNVVVFQNGMASLEFSR